MIYERCSGSGVSEKGKETAMTSAGRLLQEEDEGVYLGPHRGDDTEVGPDQDRQLKPRQSQL